MSFANKKLKGLFADFLAGHLLKLETRGPLVQARTAPAAGWKVIDHEFLFIWSHDHSFVSIKFK